MRKKFTFRIICLIIVFQLLVPVVSPVISFADNGYKTSAERAEDEAKEEHHRKTIAQQTTEYAKKRAVADFRGNTE
jgi:uncharacterized protein YpmB